LRTGNPSTDGSSVAATRIFFAGQERDTLATFTDYEPPVALIANFVRVLDSFFFLLSLFVLQRACILALGVPGAGQERPKPSIFSYHVPTAQFTCAPNISFRRRLNLALAVSGEVLAVLARWISGAGKKQSVFAPTNMHLFAALFTIELCW
jgi:hypothetical protein